MAFEKPTQVGNPPVVNIRIRTGQAPVARVSVEISAHVFVDETLQIDANSAVAANQHICADTDVRWHITIGVRNGMVGPVVAHRVPRALQRRVDKIAFGGAGH